MKKITLILLLALLTQTITAQTQSCFDGVLEAAKTDYYNKDYFLALQKLNAIENACVNLETISKSQKLILQQWRDSIAFAIENLLTEVEEEKAKSDFLRLFAEKEKDRAMLLANYYLPDSIKEIGINTIFETISDLIDKTKFEDAKIFAIISTLNAKNEIDMYLSDSLINKIDTLISLNDSAIFYYTKFEYLKAEKIFYEILKYIPDNKIIKKRIDYCEKPIFSINNFVEVPAGDIRLFSTGEKIEISKFEISIFEVTNDEFAEFLNFYGDIKVKRGEYKGEQLLTFCDLSIKCENNIYKSDYGYEKYPVFNVSWFGAVEFCNFWGLELPTMDQWEYAARNAGKINMYPWGYGSVPTEIVANIADKNFNMRNIKEKDYNDGYSYTAPVGSYLPNELGIYDLAGNVSEWVSDDYDKQNKYVMGCTWASMFKDCDISKNHYVSKTERNSSIGFRPVINKKQ